MIFMQICRGRDLTFPTQGDKILAWCVTLHSSSDGWGGGSVAAVAMYNTGQRQRNLILHLYCPKWWQFGSDTSHSQPNHCVYKTQQCAPLSPVTRDILHTLPGTLSFYSLSRRVVFIIAEVFFVVKIPRGQFKNPMQEEMTEVSH